MSTQSSIHNMLALLNRNIRAHSHGQGNRGFAQRLRNVQHHYWQLVPREAALRRNCEQSRHSRSRNAKRVCGEHAQVLQLLERLVQTLGYARRATKNIRTRRNRSPTRSRSPSPASKWSRRNNRMNVNMSPY